MSAAIDTSFDVYSDTPAGSDPDACSPTLRRFHRLLWSKELPIGEVFELSDSEPKAYLHHRSLAGEFFLSSDSIGHTYRYVKAMAPVISEIAEEELDEFFGICSTVGGYIIFPSRTVDRKPTINGARGMNWKVKDRSDLTLECIRRHYQGKASPLADDLARYADFFKLFGSFEGYVQFFHLEDLLSPNGGTIRFFLPFDDFERAPLPANPDEYRSYKEEVMAFVRARNRRIEMRLQQIESVRI